MPFRACYSTTNYHPNPFSSVVCHLQHNHLFSIYAFEREPYTRNSPPLQPIHSQFTRSVLSLFLYTSAHCNAIRFIVVYNLNNRKTKSKTFLLSTTVQICATCPITFTITITCLRVKSLYPTWMTVRNSSWQM